MTTAETALAPQQKRSRDTVQRLLVATVQLLDEHGLEGAVIPRIAARAGVSAAGVYRRFADKDALLRAAFLHVLQQSNANNRRLLRDLLLRETLAVTATRLIALLFAQYREHPLLLRALMRFLDGNPDPAFVAQIQAHMTTNLDAVVDVLLEHTNVIAHAAPATALRIAVLSATSAIENIVFEPASLWQTVQALDDAALRQQLAHAFSAYLCTAPLPLPHAEDRA